METFKLPQNGFHCRSKAITAIKERHHGTFQALSLSISQTGRMIKRNLMFRTGFTIQKQFHFKVLSIQNQEIRVLKARSMDDIYDTLAQSLLPKVDMADGSNTKYIVGLAGPPGAGKTTVASEVTHRLNVLWSNKSSAINFETQSQEIAVVLPMDGFHLYRSQLDAMENPEEAHARRGAPWTFDPLHLLTCLKRLRTKGSVYVPSFDHGVGDPVEDDIFVGPQHKVVIVEGNYLLVEDGSWKEISSMFDEKWFVDVDIDIAMERVLKRHILTGKTPETAEWRIGYNDRPNAEMIMKSKKNADLLIVSVDL